LDAARWKVRHASSEETQVPEERERERERSARHQTGGKKARDRGLL
jgi:hypothetical protein